MDTINVGRKAKFHKEAPRKNGNSNMVSCTRGKAREESLGNKLSRKDVCALKGRLSPLARAKKI